VIKWSYTNISPLRLDGVHRDFNIPHLSLFSPSQFFFITLLLRIISDYVCIGTYFPFAVLFIVNSNALDTAFVFIYVTVPSSAVYIIQITTHDILLCYTHKHGAKELSIKTAFSCMLLYFILPNVSAFIRLIIRHIYIYIYIRHIYIYIFIYLFT
jgi:hypothetical protein